MYTTKKSRPSTEETDQIQYVQEPQEQFHQKKVGTWPTQHNQRKAGIYRINQQTKEKELLYYTPLQEHQNPATDIFHPLNWSINDFQVGRHIGKGKYGHVYLVRQRKTKLIMALKVLSKRQIIKSDITYQLRRQLQIHSHLKHENILHMYGFFFDDKKIYIMIDYAPKGQLYSILKKEKKLSEERAANYIYQLIQALKYCHSMNVIHRDIKPQNILISSKDRLKLTDFGWAVHVSQNHKKRQTLCGTLEYLSPELFQKKGYDYRVDIWCMGILTYELCAGYSPFNGQTSSQMRILALKYKMPGHFSEQLADFIVKVLKVKPGERISLKEAQQHPWIKKFKLPKIEEQKQVQI